MIRRVPVDNVLPQFELQLIETSLTQFRATWTEEGLWAFEFFDSTKALGSDHSQQTISDSLARQVSTQQVSTQELRRQRLTEGGIRSRDRLASQLSAAVQRYFLTGHFDWDLSNLDWRGVSMFQRTVLQSCHQIPKGSVLTYGQLAAKVGRPAAARAVGAAMAKNRWPLIIPCHRVVGVNGKLTGYSGLGGIETKKRLLLMEGHNCAT